MSLYVSVEGQQRGPFLLKTLHEMAALGSLGDGAMVWCQETNNWIDLKQYLLKHPASAGGDPKREKASRKPSKLFGFVGAMTSATVGGVIISVIGMLAGVFLPILWWPLAWGCGEVAKSCSRTHGGLIGVFALVGTFLGIMVSFSCVDYAHPIVILGGFGMLISLPGSLWLAFKSGNTM